MLKNAPNVLMNKILLQGKEIEGSTYEDLVKGQVAQGFTPMTWLTTQIFDAQDLPEGNLQHLLDCSEEIRPRLKEFFMKFTEVLPKELPKKLPPDRGLQYIHTTELYPDARPPNRPAYKQSPAE